MQKKNPAKRRPERLVVTLLSLLFLSTAVFATVKYVFRAPELDTDKPVVTPDGTASTDVDRTGTDEPDALGRTRRKYCYNILVSGLDDDNGGSDTNILVRFDVPNKRIDLVSLPRDTLLHNEYRNNKLNFAYAKGGTELLMEQIENLLGIPVDFYVTVNLKGFIALVDQIDGVDFDIPINMDYDDPYQDLHIHFTKGPRHLNGQEAMEVVRFRHNNDGTGYGTEDIGRIGTQQAFLKAVAKQLLQIGNVKNIPALVDIFYTYVKTDLTTTASTFRSRRSLRSTKPSGTFAAASPREKNIRELETFSSEFRQIKAETDQTPHGRQVFLFRRPRKLFFPLVVC